MNFRRYGWVALVASVLLFLSSLAVWLWLRPLATPTPSPPLPTLAAPDTSALDAQIQTYRNRGALQAALYTVESTAALDGWTPYLHLQAGNLLRDMGSPQLALYHWDAAARGNPSADILRQLAELRLQRGEWGRAWEHTEQLLELSPADRWGNYHAGALLAPTDPIRAQRYLTRAAADSAYSFSAQPLLNAIQQMQSDDSAFLSKRIGVLLADEGRWSLAEHAFQYAATAFYPDAEALAYVAIARAEQDKRGEAWQGAALELAPEDANVRYLAGIYWRIAGDLDQSRTMLEAAVALDPDNAFYLAELGVTEGIAGNLTRAETLLQEALALSGSDALIQRALNNLRSRESYLLPDDYLQLARQASANDPSLLSAQGWALHVQGNTDAGLQRVEQALSLDPDNARALFDKARIFLETDRTAQAQSLLETLAAGDSAYAQAAARLLDDDIP